jgi:CelD/BcsL family acetyltransferase involved in cellulose biosynthesis
MTVHEIDPLRDPRWGKFVETHPMASVFHTVGWLRALNQSYGYDPAVLTTSGVAEQLTNGLVFCRVKSWLTGRRMVSLPFSDHCEPLTEDEDSARVLVSSLVEKSRQEGVRYLELRPVTSFERLHPAPTPSPSSQYYLHRLDLRPGLQEVSRHFHKDCIQRKIRRAERESLSVTEGRTSDILNQFYRLVVRTRRRQGLPPQPLKWFKKLSECLGPRFKIRLASKNNQPIAGILTLQHNRALFYKYGASDERFHNLGGMVYLFWTAIEDGIRQDFTQLDMGRSEINNPGLISFKEHWGALRYPLCYWRFPPPLATRNQDVPVAIKKALRSMPDRCLISLGAQLYRHIG